MNVVFDKSYSEIRRSIESYKAKGLNIFATSSFQTQSVVLLHLISRIDPGIPVYFLNTGYHFPETLDYKNQLAKLLGLTVIDLISPVTKFHQRDERGNLLFTSDPDRCCYINKVLPLEPILREYDVWITGVRGDQSDVRSRLGAEAHAAHNVIRYHPMIGWMGKMIAEYIQIHNLPRHPLDGKGYLSIGCQPCTKRVELSENADGRAGRWFGMKKTECGLHTELVK